MTPDPIPALLAQVDPARLRRHVHYLAGDPLPCRRLNYTLPGHAQSTLDEADAYVEAQLTAWGYRVEREACRVQAFRRDYNKPIHEQFSPPHADDPWYTAFNLYATRAGTAQPEEIVVIVSHKDSPSWVASPGAHDNAVGTAGNLEIARILSGFGPRRTVRILFCNEEHTPWTSITAARRAQARGERIVAVFNLDGLGSKGPEDAGRKLNVTRYTTPEGKWLADLMVEVNAAYAIGLEQSVRLIEEPDNDDGVFVQHGFLSAVHNCGSMPNRDPHYHLEGDRPENVDIENVAMAVRASLAAVVRVAAQARSESR